uniref:hypothetical protein n=1 Tax=Marinobacterium profundum TaxID=1714300 RepID=UPI00082C8090|nr:hypothetical protein [Marinobacterium profundum]
MNTSTEHDWPGDMGIQAQCASSNADTSTLLPQIGDANASCMASIVSNTGFRVRERAMKKGLMQDARCDRLLNPQWTHQADTL